MAPTTCVFRYMYRDGSNYKAWHEVGLTGELRPEHAETMGRALLDGTWFVAEQVGLPPLQGELMAYGGRNEDDHAFHEFQELAQAEPGTQSAALAPICDVEELVARFTAAAGRWKPGLSAVGV